MNKLNNMKERDLDLLGDLLSAPSPTGYEVAAKNVFCDHMSNFSNHAFSDSFQNSAFTKGAVNGRPIMLSAHYDELGFMISDISESGLCNIVCLSGEDRRVLPGSRLSAIVGDKLIDGVILYKPIHVQTNKEYNSIAKVEDLLLDFGTTTKEELKNLGIEVGTLVVYPKFDYNLEFGPSKNFIVGNSLDDKLGVYVVAEIMRRVSEKRLVEKNITLFGVGISGEESGLRGAKVAARRIDPEISIDFDVTPSTEKELGISTAKYGNIELGKGAVIEYGPDKSRRLCTELRRIADNNNIPYQIGIGRAGGTNTSKIQEHASDCETMLVSLPNRNMHQQNEMCHWEDVEACIELIVRYLED